MQGHSSLAAADTAGALGWLVAAGVDCAVDAAPRNWLTPPVVRPKPATQAPARSTPSPGARENVASVDVATFDALAQAVAAFAHPLRRPEIAPCLFSGNTASGVMILCDQPEPDGSPAASLRDKMLAAIGLDAGNCALLHRLPWPTTGGRTPRADEITAFAPFVARALELGRSRLLLALGQSAAALAGDAMAVASARGRWADVAVNDTQVPMLATCHPRLLLSQPLRKREAWADLQAFAARLNQP